MRRGQKRSEWLWWVPNSETCREIHAVYAWVGRKSKEFWWAFHRNSMDWQKSTSKVNPASKLTHQVTALGLFRRYYLRQTLISSNPLVLMKTVIILAAKIEEVNLDHFDYLKKLGLKSDRIVIRVPQDRTKSSWSTWFPARISPASWDSEPPNRVDQSWFGGTRCFRASF